MKRFSIIHNLDDKTCFVCGKTNGHIHEIFFGTANRKISIEQGFCVYLCPAHHNTSNYGVHFNRELDLKLKQLCQSKYEETHTREEFMKLIGKNYL